MHDMPALLRPTSAMTATLYAHSRYLARPQLLIRL
jgi:hypothetical protein